MKQQNTTTSSADTVDLVAGAYTIEQAARLLDCSYHLIWRAIKSGELPAYRLANSHRITRGDLAAWLDTRRVA